MATQKLDFESIKAQSDFLKVVTHYGLKVFGQGDQIKVRCPFHNDSTPSMGINLTRKCFSCFGCKVSGNILDWVAKREGCDLRGAAKKLMEICGLEGAQEPRRTTQETPQAEPAPEKPLKPLGFRLPLEWHPYLEERGVSRELAELYHVGYASKGSMEGRIAFGIFLPDQPEANPAGYIGRWAADPVPEEKERWMFPPAFPKSKTLFGLQHVLKVRHLIIVESPWAVLRFRAWRLPSVALMGTSMSRQQMQLLADHCDNLKHVTLLLDQDPAGWDAAPKIAGDLASYFFTRFVWLMKDEDVDTVDEAALRTALKGE